MPYCITLRSRTDKSITGWYDGATADGRPITNGRGSSRRDATPNQYAMNCAISARATPTSSKSRSQPIRAIK